MDNSPSHCGSFSQCFLHIKLHTIDDNNSLSQHWLGAWLLHKDFWYPSMANNTLQVPQYGVHESPWSDPNIHFHPYLSQNLVHRACHHQLTYLALSDQPDSFSLSSPLPVLTFPLRECTHASWNVFLSDIGLKNYNFIFNLNLNCVIPWKLPSSSALSLAFPSSEILQQQFLYLPHVVALCELSLGCSCLASAFSVPGLC